MAAVSTTVLTQRSPGRVIPFFGATVVAGDFAASAGGNRDTIFVRSPKLTLSSAQLLALDATPIDLLAAPGAGFFIDFHSLVVTKPAGTAYASVGAADDITIRETDGSGLVLATIETTGFLDSAAVQTRTVNGLRAASGVSDVTRLDNAKLVLFLGGNITTGTSPLHFYVYYRVVPSSVS